MTITNNYVPIKLEKINPSKLKNLLIKKKPYYDLIDEEILKGPSNFIIDDRIIEVKKNFYEVEMYQLFRLHLSNFLTSNPDIKNMIEAIISNKTMQPIRDKKINIKKILYSTINIDLYNQFNDQINKRIPDYSDSNLPIHSKTTAKNEKLWLSIMPDEEIIDYSKYESKNIRELCDEHMSGKTCGNIFYCSHDKNSKKCSITLKKEMVIGYVNKITEELIQNDLKASEILKREKYYVSDIIDHNRFTERPNQKIIKSNVSNINKIMSELFGADSIPKIGKRDINLRLMGKDDELNLIHNLKDMNEWYVQDIINNNYTIIRSYANSFYWITYPELDVTNRNLGYYSDTQTKLCNFFRGKILEWILEENNQKEIMSSNVKKFVKSINDFVNFIVNDIMTTDYGEVELYILTKLFNTVTYIYDNDYTIIYVFAPNKGLIYDKNVNDKPYKHDSSIKLNDIIHLKYSYITQNKYPDKVDVIYPKRHKK